MAIMLKIVSVQVCSIQIMQIRVQNKSKRVWKSRYNGDVSVMLGNVVFQKNSYDHARSI